MSESEIGVTSTQLYAWAKGDEGEETFFAVKPAEAYPQDSVNEFIIRKLNPLVVVDFSFISAFLHA